MCIRSRFVGFFGLWTISPLFEFYIRSDTKTNRAYYACSKKILNFYTTYFIWRDAGGNRNKEADSLITKWLTVGSLTDASVIRNFMPFSYVPETDMIIISKSRSVRAYNRPNDFFWDRKLIEIVSNDHHRCKLMAKDKIINFVSRQVFFLWAF